MAPKLCCNSGIFFFLSGGGWLTCVHTHRLEKVKIGTWERLDLGGFVCKVAVLCGWMRRRPLTSADSDGALWGTCVYGSLLKPTSPRGSAAFVSRWVCQFFDKHDLLPVNIHTALHLYFLFYANICLEESATSHYNDKFFVWLPNERCPAM